MKLTEVRYGAQLPVEGYAPGAFRIGGELREGPLALLPSGPVDWAGLPDLSAFLPHADAIDVLLVGTGPEIAHIDPAQRATLDAAGIGVETMASPPACRTYNVLLSEGRRIALAAMPI